MPRRIGVLAIVLAVLAIGGFLATRVTTSSARATHQSRPREAARTTRTTTTTTTTTIPPGELPQTKVLPSASGPAFLSRMRGLLAAIASDEPARAMPAFFPLAAYLQVKAIPDPAVDWHTRLIANFYQDIGTFHAALGPNAATARFVSVSVPNAAEWILPGVEYNKGSYWRVYDTVVNYTIGGRAGQFTVTSMISWRGEWYVVHLGAIR